MASSRKKAIVRKLTQEWIAGYLPSDGFVHQQRVELLGLDGRTTQIPVTELKWICFVRDFNSGEPANPERLLRKTFAGRPRTPGVLVRILLRDGDSIEGLAANDLSLVSGEGIFLTPPDIRSNTQRIWIAPGAAEQLEILSVIGAAKRGSRSTEGAPSTQESLF